MKFIFTVFIVIIPLLCKSQTSQNKNNLHYSINVTGGDLSSEEGSVSFSISQVYYISFNGQENYVSEGIQQPLISSSTNLVEKEEEIFRVAAYPNPATNYFTIEASTYTDRALSYQLMDINGRFLIEGKIGKSRTQVDVSNLSLALYLLIISDNGKQIKTIKIIKS